MIYRMFGVVLFCLCSGITYANAKVSYATHYNYFKIQGHSAREIYLSLLHRAKALSGKDEYANIDITFSQKPDFVAHGSCAVKKYELHADFQIHLPRLVSPNIKIPATQAAWRTFVAKLKAHEEHHQALWLACARALDEQLSSLKANDCPSLGREFQNLWHEMQTSCQAANDHFDANERIQFLKQPLIKSVFSRR